MNLTQLLVLSVPDANGVVNVSFPKVELPNPQFLVGYQLSGYVTLAGAGHRKIDFLEGQINLYPKNTFLTLPAPTIKVPAAALTLTTEQIQVGNAIQLREGDFQIAPLEFKDFELRVQATDTAAIGKQIVINLVIYTDTIEQL